jgi:hypothetical protein
MLVGLRGIRPMVLRACAALLAGEPAEAALLADADIQLRAGYGSVAGAV